MRDFEAAIPASASILPRRWH